MPRPAPSGLNGKTKRALAAAILPPPASSSSFLERDEREQGRRHKRRASVQDVRPGMFMWVLPSAKLFDSDTNGYLVKVAFTLPARNQVHVHVLNTRNIKPVAARLTAYRGADACSAVLRVWARSVSGLVAIVAP